MSTSFAPLAFPVLKNSEFTEVAERARVQGHTVGYTAGRREALESLAAEKAKLRAEHEAALATEVDDFRIAFGALRVASAQLTEKSSAVIEISDSALLRAAVDIATVIVGHEILDREGSALAAVRRALAAAGDAPVRGIRMNPRDVEIVAEAAGGNTEVRLVADDTIERGDSIAELVDGIVDARIGTALARVRAALEEDEA